MKTQTIKLLAAGLAWVPLLAAAGESVDRHWDIDAGTNISIENSAGNIEIQGWSKKAARLTGDLGNSVKELKVTQSGSGLQIVVVNRNERNVDKTVLKLQVPAKAVIEATAVSADIKIKGMQNEKISGSSVSGDVEVQANSERVSLESVSGDVTFSGNSSRVSAESVSGDIALSGVNGEIYATTVSGDLQLQTGNIDTGKLETVSGDMDISGSVASDGSLTAESMSGDVVISLPTNQTGLFKAESFSGRIDTSFGSVEHSRHGPGSHLKTILGDGSSEIRVESFSGDIKLRKN